MAFQLPNAGDIEGQVQSGNNLISQIHSAANDPTASAGLLEAGISLVANAIGGPGGAVLTDALGGAMSGFAMAGPMGAVAGAIVGLAEGILGLFQGADAVVATVGVSAATQTISAAVQAIGAQHPDILTGKPQGWAMADWAAFARPPHTTKNSKTFFAMMQAVSRYVASTITPGLSELAMSGPYAQNDSGDPSNIANALCGTQWQMTSRCNNYTPAQFAAWQKSLCTPVWFDWYQPGQIEDCEKDLFFGSGGAGGNVSALLQTWINSTYAQNGLSQQQIVQRAVSSMIDPMYFGSDLYGLPMPSGFSGWGTVYYNPDLMNAVATVLMMRSAGASTQAIVSELLIQAAILSAHGSQDPSGNKLPGDVKLNQYGFHQLLDDHIRMAQTENALIPPVSTAPAGLSTGAQIATVFGAAGATMAVGLLGYSAYKKQSPVDVLQGLRSRIRARRVV